ncbi:hypothetical protein G6K98_00030 [Agrobacterium rhizogenes]|nr:hypothetical protein [Rhizobium rhizogenes]NTH55886.1 hypothetical protein [Rhizobium rhizogenes]NTH87516.1 hypothetical protein [Rhizobium rhizogenes]
MNLYFSRNVNNYSMIDLTGAIKMYFDEIERGHPPIAARYEGEQFSVFATASRDGSPNAVYDLFIVASEDEAQSDGFIEFFKFDREFLQKLISSYANPVRLPTWGGPASRLQ